MDDESLTHTKWNCKYHIVFAPKYRRQVIYGKVKMEIGKMLIEMRPCKRGEVLERDCCLDHINMLLHIPPKIIVSSFMRYQKEMSRLMI